MAYIYKITNTVNGKLYIGQTVKNIEVRFKEHVNASKNTNYKLYKAMRKYGTDNFIIKVLQECPKEQLNELEIYWIDKLDTIKNGYNLTKGGQHTSVNIYKKVRKYTTDFQYVQTYESIADAARDIGLTPSTILDCLKTQKESNYRWRIYLVL